MPYNTDSKIIIVGSGVFGLSTALHLTKNGFKNITIYDRTDYETEKYSPLGASDAASGDINKFFRIYYENKTHYSKLAIEALGIWESWNKEILNLPEEDKKRFLDDDLELLRLSGGLRIDKHPNLVLNELKNLEGFTELGLRDTQYDINSERDLLRAKLTGLDRKLAVVKDLKERNKVSSISGTLDSIGRMIKADKACYYVKLLLEKEGVEFVYGEAGTFKKPIYCSTNSTVVKGIKTADGLEHHADLVIVSAGSWATSLIPQLQHRAQASLANVVYLEIPKSRQDLIDKYSEYPHIQWNTTSSESERHVDKVKKGSSFAWFPNTKKEGILKVNTRQIKYLNPVDINGTYISVPETLGDERLPKSVVLEAKKIFLAVAPDVAALEGVKLKTKLLWYTDTINTDFIIDYVPNYKNLLLAGGGASHSFKFLPVLGKFVVNKILGNTDEYTHFFRWKNPEDIIVDHYDLKDEHIETNEKRKLSNVVLADESDLYFTPEELKNADSIILD